MEILGNSPGVRYVIVQQEVVPPLPPFTLPLTSPRTKDSTWLLWNNVPLAFGVQGLDWSGPSPLRNPTSGGPFVVVVSVAPHSSGEFSAQMKWVWLPRSAKNGFAMEPQDPLGGQVTANSTEAGTPVPPPFW